MILNFVLISGVVIFALYLLKIVRLRFKWDHYPVFQSHAFENHPCISIVIAFRNEFDNLPVLLKSLENQDYPGLFYEVILVDDASDDQSDKIVKAFCEENHNFRYIHNQDTKPGKKTAIKTGILNASFSLIVTTDADCIAGEKWLSSIAQYYVENKPGMIIGLVDIHTQGGFFNRFQETEFLSLVASGAGAAADNRYIYCNAANLAFEKGLFNELHDPLYEMVESGDDTFFLHNAKIQGKKIGLLKSNNAIVHTLGQKTWKGYLNQRLRWVSKSRYYKDGDTIYTALLVLCTNVFMVISLFMMILQVSYIFPLLFAMKVLTDYWLLSGFMKFYSRKSAFTEFIVFSIIYPFTVIGFAVLGLTGSFHWKGRNFN